MSFEGRILEVQSAQRRLRNLQARRDDALAFISHDVRAPLAGAVQQLQSGTLDEAGRLRLLGQLRRAHDLAQGFLNLSRAQSIEVSELVELDLGAVLHQAADFAYDEALAQGVRFERSLPDEPIWVRGDFDALERLVTNLLRNAVQHSPAQAVVTIGAALTPRAVRFWVRDQGPGLSEAQVERLFQRFSRGGDEGGSHSGSTGLGLYYVRLVAEKHGGTAGVQSTPRQGATFWVELPRIE